jgi:hypothetical protein
MDASVAHDLFATVPPTNYLGLFDDAEPDLGKTVQFLGLKKQEVATATGVPRDSVRYDSRVPAELRERLSEIATICEMVAAHFDGNIGKAALWFQLENPLLGHLSPRDQIRLGRYRKVLKFVRAAQEAAQPPARR